MGFTTLSGVHGMFVQDLEHPGSDFGQFGVEMSVLGFRLGLSTTINGSLRAFVEGG